MLDATRSHDAPLTAERLFGWHAALFPTGRSGMTKIIVRNWRNDSTGPTQVVSGPYGRERVHYAASPATRVASSASVSTVDRGSVGPVFISSTVARLRHFATVFGLMLSSRLSCASEACDRCIAALTACVVVALP